MKIVHICLACFYVEGMGYQENILTQFHAEMGHDVTILTSDYTFNPKYQTETRENWDYVNDFGVHVKVLGKQVKYGAFEGLYEELDRIKPDVIMAHGGQFVAIRDVIKYCKRNKDVLLYIDQHADYYNTPVNTFKRRLAQKLIYGRLMRKAVRYTKKFWGVTPWRCTYLNDVYGIPKSKIDLLVMGGDDRYIHFENRTEIRANIRERLGFGADDFVLITGGKIDAPKNIHLLMKAMENIDGKAKLIVFGQPNDAMAPIIEELSKNDRIRHIGWIDAKDVYDYYLASDLAVFPGTHSVLWEQACATGLPGVYKDWEGMHHVNVDGSAVFVKDVSAASLAEAVNGVINGKYDEMKAAAENKGRQEFSYRKISARAIGLDE